MNDLLTVRGFVASEVRTNLTEQGWPVATFRLGSTERRYDRVNAQWVDAGTNWYTVSMFRGLAQNASCSVSKGERVIVTGKLKLRQWANGERRGVAPEIDAEAVGHDLVWGTARFKRTGHSLEIAKPAEPLEAAESSAASHGETPSQHEHSGPLEVSGKEGEEELGESEQEAVESVEEEGSEKFPAEKAQDNEPAF